MYLRTYMAEDILTKVDREYGLVAGGALALHGRGRRAGRDDAREPKLQHGYVAKYALKKPRTRPPHDISTERRVSASPSRAG